MQQINQTPTADREALIVARILPRERTEDELRDQAEELLRFVKH